jgi:SprT protein
MVSRGVDPEVHAKVLDAVSSAITTLRTATGYGLPLPCIVYRSRGRTAGRAFFFRNVISLNPGYLNNGELDAMLTRTIPHEVAHLFAYVVYKDRGHGRGWSHMMYKLGLPAKRCHSYSLDGVVKTAPFTCGCPGVVHNIGMVRVRKINRGTVYFCAKCRVGISPAKGE